MSRLLFVEGRPGTGKSTPARTIERSATSASMPARCLYEAGSDNPLRFGYGAGDPNDYVTQELQQIPMFGPMQADVEAPLLEGLVERLFEVVLPLGPRLIRLTGAIEDSLQSAASARSPELFDEYVLRNERSRYAGRRGLTGEAGLFAFWRDFEQRVDGLVPRFPGPTLSVDSRRASTDRAVLDFLGVRWDGDLRLPHAVLAGHAGRYAGPETPPFLIDVHDECLVAHGPLPQVWQAGTQLVACGEHVFEARSRPTE